MKGEKSDRKIILFLCLALSLEVFFLFKHLGLLSWFDWRKASAKERVLAGYVLTTENDLRRRNVNSLIWEPSENNDPLYYHDSLLTLSHSQAVLSLNENTQIHLGENTLVTLEPEEDQESGQIRLRFQRGDLKAKNSGGKLKVENKNWAIELKKDSDMNLRQIGEESYEVSVISGEVHFQEGENQQLLNPDQILRLEKNQNILVKKDESLTWLNPPARRIYSHDERVPLELHWQGPAETLVIQESTQNEKQENLPQDLKMLQLPLTYGSYHLFLRTHDKTSEVLALEIWPAPQLQLLSPLPRDRLRTHDPYSFFWSQDPGISEYQLEFVSTGGLQSQRSKDNRLEKNFSQEGDFDWQVRGFDQDGFEIPPRYSLPIYVRDNPLSAPKPKAPTILRQPADKKNDQSRWFEKIKEGLTALAGLLLPSAVAAEAAVDEQYEAVFAWEPVAGASSYTIEITDNPDFRSPLVSRVTDKTEFTYSGLSKKKYYWRVASGSKSNHLGFFSEALTLDLKNLKPGEQDIQGVKVREKKIAMSPPPVKTVAEPPVSESPLPVINSAPPKLWEISNHRQRFIFWQPNYLSANAHGKSKVRADIKGSSSTALGMYWLHPRANNQALLFSGQFSGYTISPDPLNEFLFQPEQQWKQFKGQVYWVSEEKKWAYGAEVNNSLAIERADHEAIALKNAPGAGPSLIYQSLSSPLETYSHLSLLAGPSLLALSADFLVKAKIFQSRYFLGTAASGQYQWSSGEQSEILQFFVLLGAQF